MKGISIVIRSFNEERFIARLLVGIEEQTIQDAETILAAGGGVAEGDRRLAPAHIPSPVRL
jgi:hypothetical protein